MQRALTGKQRKLLTHVFKMSIIVDKTYRIIIIIILLYTQTITEKPAQFIFMLTYSTVLYSISGIAETCLGRGVRNTTAVGWRDLALFTIFEKRHISADQVYV